MNIRYILPLLSTLFGLGLLLSACSGETKEAAPDESLYFNIPVDLDGTEETAIRLGRELGIGWNIGNSMDAHVNGVSSEVAWNNDSIHKEVFDSIRAYGFRSVRIPITWLGHMGPAPEYKVDEAWMDRVAQLVDWAEEDSLYVIINLQHDASVENPWLNFREAANDSLANERIMVQYRALWRQIAERFKDKGSFLIFEGANEIHDGSWGWGGNMYDGGKQYRLLSSWMQEFVHTVRAVGGKNRERYLGIVGYCQDAERTCASLIFPDDPVPNRLLVSVHFYSPVQFTLSGEVDHFGAMAAPNRSIEWCTERYIDIIFQTLHDTFIAKGIPVYIGESSCIHRENRRSELFRLYYLEYVWKAAQDGGMPVFYWDNGNMGTGYECSGIIDHSTGQITNNGLEVIEAFKRAAYTHDDPTYTTKYLFEHAPRSY